MATAVSCIALAAVGTMFLFVALDYNDVNTNMARWRAQFRKNDADRATAFEDHFASHRAIGWIGASGAFLGAVVLAVEAIVGWHPK